MAVTGSAQTTIDADKASVMAVIAALEDYPQWLGPVKRTEVLATGDDGRPSRARFEVEMSGVRDAYVLDYVWQGDDAVTWTLVEGRSQKAQEGAYRLSEEGDGTRVQYELSVELAVKLPGFLVKRAQQGVMTSAVGDLKKRVEG